MLSKDEIKRYSRHLLLSEIGNEGQERLKKAKVLIVGAGGLGCPALQYLASAGVGTIGIADGDVVDESNLQRQILFMKEDVGKNKAAVAKEKLSKSNPHIHLISQISNLTSGNALEVLNGYDLVIDGSDNFPTRYLMNDACVMLGKPLVFGSIFKFEGQVSVFNYKDGPTYRCLFPEPPSESPNCSEIGVLSVLPGMIGTLMANEALKIILEIGEPLAGKLFVLDALTMQTKLVSFIKDPHNSKVTYLIDYELFCNPVKAMDPMQAEIVKEMPAAELRKLIESKADFQLIDVREPFEYVSFNLEGENIPLGSIEAHTDKISRKKKVVIHCKGGSRSRMAIKILQKKYGYTNLYNLTGGIETW